MSSNKTVLISGGAGYIGSHTAVELINAGYNVVIIDNLSNSEKEAVDGVRKITGKDVVFEIVDTCDKTALRQIFKSYDFDSVIHFAAYKAVGESMAEPLMYYQNNLVSFMNIVEMMKEFNRPNILFSSSATVYGEAENLPVTEQTPRQPATSPYGNTKQIAEDILHDCCRAYEGVHGIALRYFNPIGAHPSALIGELPRGVPNNLVPFITQTAAGIRKELSVFGNDYDTPDGTGVRDFIHVMDLAKGHVKALKKLEDHSGLSIYNLGTGVGYSVLDVVKNFEKATGIQIPYEIKPRRAGDIATCYSDASKAKRELGWEAEYGILEMCRDSWNWQKKNPNGY